MRLMSSLFLATTTLACSVQPIEVPGDGIPHHAEHAVPEPEDWQRLLPAQIDQVRQAAKQWEDFDHAKKTGWRAFGHEEPLMGQHYYNPKEPDYVAGQDLDFSRPNNLMYAESDGRMTLTGVAFVVRIGADDPVPAGFAGPEDTWHVHDFVAAINAATEKRPLMRGVAKWWLNDNYFKKGDNRYRLAMVHVWTQHPNPDGVFADFDRTLPYRRACLPASWSEGGSVETARGVNMATDKGCENTLGGQAWIAHLSRAQKRQLLRECEHSASAIRAALPLGRDALNETARSAWNDYRELYDRIVTAEQKQRLAAMTEHSHHHSSTDM